MSHIFKGWVPTVSGRLSFSEIGDTRTPSTSIYANVSDHNRRYIVCYQGRDLSDALYPEFLREFANNRLHKRQGRFWFVLLGKTDEADTYGLERLSGRILIIADKKVWKHSRPERFKYYAKQAWHYLFNTYMDPPKKEDRLKERIEKFQVKLNECSRQWRTQVLENLVDQDFSTLSDRIQNESYFIASFSLMRSGKCTVTWNPETRTHPKSPKINPDEDNAESLHAVISQAFYFLRDVAHRHQHHNPKTDTIVDIYSCQASYDDYRWRRETLYSLFRKIIHLKRIKEKNSVTNSLGLLAYAQAFVEICSREGKTKLLPEYNFASLKQSMESAQIGIQEHDKNKNSNSEKKWGTFFTVSAIFISLGILGKPNGVQFDDFHYTVQFLYNEIAYNTWRSIIWAAAATWVIISVPYWRA